MTAPVQVTFRDFPPSEAVTRHVEKRADKLGLFFGRITRCHVVVETPHRHHKHGPRFHVRIDLRVPGKEIVVSRNPESEREDLYATLDGAFGDAERILEDRATELKLGPRVNQGKAPHGRVTKLFPDRGYGFLESAEGVELYFHKNSVIHGRFERLEVGAEVRYAEELGDKGPQASTVDVVKRRSA